MRCCLNNEKNANLCLKLVLLQISLKFLNFIDRVISDLQVQFTYFKKYDRYATEATVTICTLFMFDYLILFSIFNYFFKEKIILRLMSLLTYVSL